MHRRTLVGIFILLIALAGCGETLPTAATATALIIGTWKNDTGRITQFAANGMQTHGPPAASCWSILEVTYGLVLIQEPPGANGGSTLQIMHIDATTLKLKDPVGVRTWTRIDTNGMLTAD
jgi:hypothetical protein